MNIVDAAKLAVLIQEHIPQHLWLALVWSLNHEFPDLEWYEHEDRETGMRHLRVRELGANAYVPSRGPR